MKRLEIRLGENDKDIIDCLEQKNNSSDYIRDLIRKDISGAKVSSEPMVSLEPIEKQLKQLTREVLLVQRALDALANR